MKTLFALILLASLIEARADEVRVSRMDVTDGYDARYDLKTSLNEKVVLDCQSFVQGLLLGEVGESVILMEESECQQLMGDMGSSFYNSKQHCLELNFQDSVMVKQETCE